MNTLNSQNVMERPVQAMQCFECQRYWIQTGNQLNCITCRSEFVEVVTTGRRQSFEGPIVERQQSNNLSPIQENNRPQRIPFPSINAPVNRPPTQVPPPTTIPTHSIGAIGFYGAASTSSQAASSSSSVAAAPSQFRIYRHVNAAVASTTQNPVNQVTVSYSYGNPPNSLQQQAASSAAVIRQNNIENNQGLSNNLNVPRNNTQVQDKVKKTLTSQELKNIPRVFLRNLPKDGSSECAICCDDFGSRMILRQLDCSHVFHQKCVFPWLQKDATCPICRYDMTIPSTQPVSQGVALN